MLTLEFALDLAVSSVLKELNESALDRNVSPPKDCLGDGGCGTCKEQPFSEVLRDSDSVLEGSDCKDCILLAHSLLVAFARAYSGAYG